METGETKKMTKEQADLHAHYDPVHPETAYPIVDDAKAKNIRVLGLIARGDIPKSEDLQKIIDYGKKEGRTVVLGVEYPVKIPANGFVDLIALRFDFTNPHLRKLFGIEEYKERNGQIAKRQFDFLVSQGADFENLEESDKEILARLLAGEEGTEKAIKFCRIFVHNTKNQNLLSTLKEQYTNDWQFVINTWGNKPNYQATGEIDSKFLWYIWFREGQPGYKAQGENLATRPEELIYTVHSAQGLALYSVEGKFNRPAWEYLKTIGIDGVIASGQLIQTYYSGGEELGKIPLRILKELIKQGYVVLQGSDFDIRKHDWLLGKNRFSAKHYIKLQQHEPTHK